MSPSEFFFLASGLVLGVCSGAALVEVLRARPAARREVRVTFAAAAVPARATTLTFAGSPGGIPPDQDIFAPETAPADPRTERVFRAGVGGRDRVAVPIRPEGEPVLARAGALVASSLPDRVLNRTVDRLAHLPSAATGRVPDAAPEPVFAGHEGPGTARAGPDDDPCAAARAEVDERCGLASRMAALADAANGRLREARRAYDEHVDRLRRATEVVDPRVVRAAKDEAQAAFRHSRLAARDRAALEVAASEWLREINRINLRTRTAAAIIARESRAGGGAPPRRRAHRPGGRRGTDHGRERGRGVLRGADRARRVRGGRAGRARRAAAGGLPPAAEHGRPRRLEPAEAADDGSDELAEAAVAGREPAILRLLGGDRATLRAVVERLAGPDPDAQRHWQLLLTDLVDAILARAIAATALTFPDEQPFWAPYTQPQSREISAALASLGYRFDGLGGFADGRVPSQRDLSLAIGYAGLDPMRIRLWPTEAEMPDLFRGVRVDAGRFLAEAAGGLTLGEMIDLLGRRAEPLTDLWNAWGRVRPAAPRRRLIAAPARPPTDARAPRG